MTIGTIGYPITLLWTLAGIIKMIYAIIDIHFTLTPKYSKIKTIFLWILTGLVAFGVSFLFYCIDILNDNCAIFICAITLCLGAVNFYTEPSETKLFMPLSIWLFVLVLSFMFCETTDAYLGRMLGTFDRTLGAYTLENMLLYIIIEIILIGIFTIIYKSMLAGKIKHMSHRADRHIQAYILTPIISMVSFIILNYATSTMGVTPTSSMFPVFYVPVCAIFVMEFQHIYASIRWATEATVAEEKMRLDGLTGLYNKMAFLEKEEFLNTEILSGTAKFGVLSIDLNFLKKINDTYGHEKGDEVIKLIAKDIMETFQNCECFRTGGDEFVVIVQNGRIRLVETMIKTFEKKIQHKESNKAWKHLSAAVGFAKYDHDEDINFQSVYNRADALMYTSKRATHDIITK